MLLGGLVSGVAFPAEFRKWVCQSILIVVVVDVLIEQVVAGL